MTIRGRIFKTVNIITSHSMSQKVKLVCRHCAAINQLPEDRLGDGGKCGKCGQSLIGPKPIAASSVSLNKHIANSGLPVLVDFWAPWCGPCLSFAPTFEQYATENSTAIRCIKLDTEAHQQAGQQYGIRSIPTLALFVNGTEKARISGAMNGSQLVQWVAQNLS